MNAQDAELTEKERKAIEEFQCPGCTCGSNTKCDAFKLETVDFNGCTSRTCGGHAPGTLIFPVVGKIILGLPKGFCRTGDGKVHMRIVTDGKAKANYWDKFNIPVWALEQDGWLFVRTYCPRINKTCVDVIKGGKRAELCPQAIDVGEFINDMD